MEDFRYPSKRFAFPITKCQGANDWINQENRRFENEVAQVKGPSEDAVGWSVCPAIISAIILIVTLMLTGGGWNWFAFVALTVLIAGLTGCFFCWRSSVIADTRKELLRKELNTRLQANPLHVRAEMILKATRDYEFHLGQYKLMCDQIDDSLVMHSDEVMRQAYDRLDHARKVLMDACKNFEQVVEYDRRQREFIAKHPEIKADPAGSNLAALLKEIGRPLEFLPDHLMSTPTELLERDTALEQLASDLSS